jgi:hypothetical protein
MFSLAASAVFLYLDLSFYVIVALTFKILAIELGGKSLNLEVLASPTMIFKA